MGARPLALLALVALAALSLSVQALPTITSWRTANGARVLFVEARELPIVDVSVLFDAAGSRDGDRPGLARLTNGLLAEGAAQKPSSLQPMQPWPALMGKLVPSFHITVEQAL